MYTLATAYGTTWLAVSSAPRAAAHWKPIYIYIYIYIYLQPDEDLWISNLHWMLGFPGPRWMHAPSLTVAISFKLRFKVQFWSRGHSVQGLRYCRVKALPNQPYVTHDNMYIYIYIHIYICMFCNNTKYHYKRAAQEHRRALLPEHGAERVELASGGH